MKTIFPKVSVMIPTYNQEQYITQAIESVIMQDYENLEIIVADDCSTDNTKEIVQKYLHDKRLKYIRNESNLGRVGNYRNTLYQHTTGEWILNLDGDDFYTDRTLISRAMKAIVKTPNVVCYFGYKKIPRELYKYSYKYISEDSIILHGNIYFKIFNNLGSFVHMTTLYKKAIAINDNLCYTYKGIQSDFHAIIRLCLYGDVIIAKENGYRWRFHTGNATNSFNNFKLKYKQGIECQNQIINDIGHKLSDEEKETWLQEGKECVKLTYIKDNLRFVHNIHSLRIGLTNFKFSQGYIVLYIKALIATLFKIDLF